MTRIKRFNTRTPLYKTDRVKTFVANILAWSYDTTNNAGAPIQSFRVIGPSKSWNYATPVSPSTSTSLSTQLVSGRFCGSIAYSPSQEIYVMSDPLNQKIAYSSNRTTWTNAYTNNTAFFGGIGEKNVIWVDSLNLFVAVFFSHGSNENLRSATSPDGINWTFRTIPQRGWTSLAFGNGVIVASGLNHSGVSTDGISWNDYNVFSTQVVKVDFAGGLFFATTSGNTFYTSTDGVTWTTRTGPTLTSPYTLARNIWSVGFIPGPNLYVFGSDYQTDGQFAFRPQVFTTTDFTNWEVYNPITSGTGQLHTMAFDGSSRTLIIGHNAIPLTVHTKDGVNFTLVQHRTATPPNWNFQGFITNLNK